jgi:predicted Zn-dependent peptidase
MFADHPYHYPIIGFKQDLWSVDRDTLFAFYKTHYVPNNAVLVVVGDVTPDEVFAQAQAAFGSISGAVEVPKQDFYMSKDLAAASVTIARDIKQPTLMLVAVLPGEKEKKRYVFEVLAQILGQGKSSRLYARLVDELQLATDLAAWLYRLEDATLLTIVLEPKSLAYVPDIKKVFFQTVAGKVSYYVGT